MKIVRKQAGIARYGIFCRKNLYTLLFVGIALIDWVRGSQTGGYWAMAVNCLGIIMAVFIFCQLPFAREALKWDLIWLAVGAAGSCAGYYVWYHHPGKIYPGQYITGAADVVLLGLVLLHAWRDRERLAGQWRETLRGKKELLLAGLWALMSLCMICSRYGETWQGYYFVMFGLFYLIPMEQEERRDLWDAMANGFIIVFFALQIWAFGFRPYDEVRYKGAYSNCNMNALFYLVTYVMLLYRLHALKMRERFAPEQAGSSVWARVRKACCYVLAGGMLSFMIYTLCRTALFMAAVLTIVYGVAAVLVIRRESAARLVGQWMLIGLCAAGTFPCVYGTIRYLPTILHHPVWFSGEYTVNKVHSFDPADSWKYVSLEEFLEEAVGRTGLGGLLGLKADAAESEEPVALEADMAGTGEIAAYPVTGEDEKDSGKIRQAIWKLYLENLNLTGHELEEGYFQITESFHVWHAQNIFIQAAFFYGIPAGGLMTLVLLGIGAGSVKILINSRESADILPLMSWLLFVGFGMLECVWYPGQAVLFLMYITPRILVDYRRAESRDTGKEAL